MSSHRPVQTPSDGQRCAPAVNTAAPFPGAPAVSLRSTFNPHHRQNAFRRMCFWDPTQCPVGHMLFSPYVFEQNIRYCESENSSSVCVFKENTRSELAFRLKPHGAVSIQWDPNLGTELLSQRQDGALGKLAALPSALCEKMQPRGEQTLHLPAMSPRTLETK